MKESLKQIAEKIEYHQVELAKYQRMLPDVDYEKVIEVVCHTAGISLEEAGKRGRNDLITDVRSITCMEFREYGFSLSTIGLIVDRDHSTVMYHLNRYGRLYKSCPRFKALAKACGNAVHETFQPIIINLAS